MTQNELQEDEYFNRKLYFEIEVKNNISVPQKFHGSRNEFDIAFKKYFDSDTYGKIIDYTIFTHNELIENHNIETIRKNIDDINNYYDNFGSNLGFGGKEDYNKKTINKRYHKYL